MPIYPVDHLATFAIGPKFDVMNISHGIQRFKELDNKGAIWAEAMILRIRPDSISVENKDGEIVEQWATDLVLDAMSYIDARERYNNVLVILVREQLNIPQEMHIFQCSKGSANDVCDDVRDCLRRYSSPQHHRPSSAMARGIDTAGSGSATLGGGRRTMTRSSTAPTPDYFDYRTQQRSGAHQQQSRAHQQHQQYQRSSSSSAGATARSEQHAYTLSDLNVLNRCLDEVEAFVARLQQIAHIHKEREEIVAAHQKDKKKGKKGLTLPPIHPSFGLPIEEEFVDILQKFKLSLNLLGGLQNNIRDPDAPTLAQFLFGTPLSLIVDACRKGLGKDIPPMVVSPLLSRQTKDLLQSSLHESQKHLWYSLGEPWTKSENEWYHAKPQRYFPRFWDGYEPYGNEGQPRSIPSIPVPVPQARQSSYSSQAYYSQVQPAFSTPDGRSSRIREEERRIAEERKLLEDERKRLEDEKRRLHEEIEKTSVHSSKTPTTLERNRGHKIDNNGHAELSFHGQQEQFLQELRSRDAKVACVTYERSGVNPKELSVTKDEYLEVLNDSKNWWECRNSQNRIGYVPRTIMTIITDAVPPSIPPPSMPPSSGRSDGVTAPLFVNPNLAGSAYNQYQAAVYSQGMSNGHRRNSGDVGAGNFAGGGKRGEFKHF